MKINYNIVKNSVLLKNITCIILLLGLPFSVVAQEVDKEKQKVLKESKELLSEANYEMANDNFTIAEATYREAIALNPKDDTGKYNLGNAYYNKEMNDVAMSRFKQAAAVAATKADKHSAFHNLGNTYMNEKKYQEAVESYKNALRNNPKDEETRYNYALAKELLEDQEQNGGGDDDNKEDQEDQKDEEKKENQDNENNKKDGEDGDQKDENDKGDEEQDKKEGDENKDKGKPDEPKEEKQQEQQPTEPGKLSPQQVKNLLEAMNNEEKKVQDKINAKKQKGTKVKSEKDW